MVQFLKRFAAAAALVFVLSGVAGAAAPQGSGLPTTTVVCDGVATGTVQLQTVSVTGYYSQSTRARIKGSTAEYILIPHQGTADGDNLVDASDGRQWQKIQSGGGAPAAHAATHEAGGSDPVPLDLLAAPSDTTTLNASTSAHGLLRKLSGTSTDCLLGTGSFVSCLQGISIAAGTLLGNNGGSSGPPAGLTGPQVKALIQTAIADVVDSTATGQALVTAGSAAAARLTLGLGSLSLQSAGAVSITGGAIDSTALTGVADPVNPQDAANKRYVDSLWSGLSWKQAVSAATTTAGTLATSFANGQVIDGVTLATGNRILVKDQADGTANGIYVVQASGAPVRSIDADASAELLSAAVFVTKGTANGDRAWVVTNDTITLGTTSITWIGFASSLGALIAGNNLTDLPSPTAARAALGLVAVATSGSATDLTTGTISAGRLPATTVTAGSYGSASTVPGYTVGADGRLTAAASTPIAIANTAVSGLGTLSTQSGTFSGTSSGTNTGDQTLSGLGGVAKAGDTMSGDLAMGGNKIGGSKGYRFGTTPGGPTSTVGGASPILVDWTAGDIQEKVLSANITGAPTFTAPAGTFGFVRLSVRIKQPASGGPYTIAAWPTNARWPSGQLPILPTAASTGIWVTCMYDGTVYECQVGGNAAGYSWLDFNRLRFSPANDNAEPRWAALPGRRRRAA